MACKLKRVTGIRELRLSVRSQCEMQLPTLSSKL